jgi:hypothetical protein
MEDMPDMDGGSGAHRHGRALVRRCRRGGLTAFGSRENSVVVTGVRRGSVHHGGRVGGVRHWFIHGRMACGADSS